MNPVLPKTTSESNGLVRFDRRVLLKASALLASMATGTFFGQSVFPTDISAQWNSAASFDWTEAEQIDSSLIGSGEVIEIDAPFLFTSVGVSWPAEIGSWPIVEIEIIENDGSVSGSFPISVSSESGPSITSDRIFSPLVCARQGSSIRYRTTDSVGNPSPIPGLTLTFIDTGQGPELDDFPRSISAKAAWDGAAPPIFLTRSDWGADESYRFEPDGEWWMRDYQSVEHAIVHHSETSNTQDPLDAIRSIYYYHAVTRGWHDIGYNYLVDKYGNIYEGRAGGRNVVGGHAYEYAHGSTGLCFIGEYFDQEITPEALASMVAILAWTCRDLDPLGTSDFHSETNLPTICAHRDVNLATCPGDRAYDELPLLRELVAQTLAHFGNTPRTDLVVGDQVRTERTTPIYTDPGIDTPVDFTLGEFMVGMIVEGPQLADDLYWYRISTDIGNGWVESSALFRDPPIGGSSGIFGYEDVVELTDDANLRWVPGLRADIVQHAPKGTVGMIVSSPEDADGYRWYRIMTNERFAWVASTYLTWSDQPAPNRPQSAETPAAVGGYAEFEIGDTVFVSDGPVNVRNSADPDSEIITELPPGFEGIVIDGPAIAGDYIWYEIEIDTDISGWVAGAYLSRN